MAVRDAYDVVVVGAGGAGLNIAQLLGKYELKVCLIDSKANPTKVTFHTLGSFADLNRFGLSKKIIAAPQTEVYLHSKHFHTRKTGKASILNKQRLHKELLDKVIQNKVEVKFSTRLKNFTTNQQGLVEAVVDNKGRSHRGRIFIDASGVAGFFSRKLGLQDKKLNIARGLEYNVEYIGPQYQSHLFIGKLHQGGYGWVFPFGDKRAILGCSSSYEGARFKLKKRLDAMFEVDVIKRLVRKDNEKIEGGTIPITSVKTKFVHKNVACVGDSVSQVNPLVGEGYRFALEAGLIAASYVCDAIRQNDLEILKGYEKEWYGKFYKKYRLAKWLQIIARKASKNDLLIDVAALFLSTKQAKTFSNLLSGNITIRDLCLP